MSNLMLATKLRIPRAHPALVSRARLLEQLRTGADRPLTLIAAPAGFGKTSLAAEWAQAAGWPVAWITLDPDDNDPARFLGYLVAALQTLDSALGLGTLAALRTQPLPPPPVLLTPLLNEISALPGDCLLVLDDYHLIESQTVHAAMTFLIDQQPPPLHLVIGTRADPPLPIARLRARGQLNELRQADLSFTADEAAALLSRSAGLDLSETDLAILMERTEGWAAGLQMAAASLKGQDAARITRFIRDFSGTHRHVLDYLVEEILQRQPEALQTFLLRTSILARLTGPLCDAVLDADEALGSAARIPSALVLENLERSNLFITALDERREWYRYHPLFADLLRSRLKAGWPEHLATLHRRAGTWLAGQGLLPEAIPHALAAGDYDEAAALIERAVPAAWRAGEIFAWAGWLKALPEAVLRSRPGLCLYDTLSHLLSARSLREAEARLQTLDGHVLAGAVGHQAKVLRAILAMFHGDLTGSRALAQEAIDGLPAADLFRGLAIRALSGVALFMGDLSEVERLLAEDARVSQAAGDRLGASASLRRLGSVQYSQGRLQQAEALYRESLKISVDARGQPWPSAGRALAHLAEIAYDRNDLAAAQDDVAESLALLADFLPTWNITGYLLLARLRQAQGDGPGADQAMAGARALARESETSLDDLVVGVHQARLWLRQGQSDAVIRWAEARGQEAGPGQGTSARDLESLVAMTYLREIEQTTLARLALSTARPDQALERLAPLLEVAERQGRQGSVIEIQILRALALAALEQRDQARAALEHALRLAEPEGFVRVFLDEGERVQELLAQSGSAYARKLVSEFSAGAHGEPGNHRRPLAPLPAIEPVSERELEVLRLIADGLSNQAIAAKLFLSIYTVKYHTYNLYGKLGVHSRTQAVARARSLGLLPAG